MTTDPKPITGEGAESTQELEWEANTEYFD